MEIWRDIPGYEGLYMVSNYGNVKSLKRPTRHGTFTYNEVILKPAIKRGYCVVFLYKNKKVNYFQVSRLVAIAFIPNPENKPYVDHIDTNKLNNKVENLRWVTASENMNNPLTKEHLRIKLRNRPDQSRPVIQLTLDDEIVAMYPSAKEVQRKTDFKQSLVSHCCNNEYGKKKNIYKGYKWVYKSEYEKLYGKIDE